MSNNIQKAEALRRLADLVESGNIPDGVSPYQPIRTYIGYGSAEEVDRAGEAFVAEGLTLQRGGAENEIPAVLFETGEYWAALEVSLYNWGDSDD